MVFNVCTIGVLLSVTLNYSIVKMKQAIPNGNYEYKISVGGTWTENYGVNGSPDGANIKHVVSNGPQDLLIEFDWISKVALTYVLVDGKKQDESSDITREIIFEMDDPVGDEWGQYPQNLEGKEFVFNNKRPLTGVNKMLSPLLYFEFLYYLIQILAQIEEASLIF